MRIGFFGGSFDPPHSGHLAVARAAAQAFSLDMVLLVPTGHQPLKPSGPEASYIDRLAMVTLLCESARHDCGTLRLEPSSLEAPLPNDEPNYTVDTITRLKTTLAPGDKLFILLGADAFLQFPQWRSPDHVLALAEWIIVSRPGFHLNRLEELPFTAEQRSRIHLLPTLADPTSATALRRLLAVRAPEKELANALPATVLRYIREHHLYETEG
jgi:nicotinate-nucleotide adenylyltransferase